MYVVRLLPIDSETVRVLALVLQALLGLALPLQDALLFEKDPGATVGNAGAVFAFEKVAQTLAVATTQGQLAEFGAGEGRLLEKIANLLGYLVGRVVDAVFRDGTFLAVEIVDGLDELGSLLVAVARAGLYLVGFDRVGLFVRRHFLGTRSRTNHVRLRQTLFVVVAVHFGLEKEFSSWVRSSGWSNGVDCRRLWGGSAIAAVRNGGRKACRGIFLVALALQLRPRKKRYS